MTALSSSEASRRRPEPALADDVRLYLEVAAKEPLLTKDEEVELATIIEKGKEAEEKLHLGKYRTSKSKPKAEELVEAGARARCRFILANLRLVVSVARKYQGQGLSLLDLIQEGNIGLMRGVELFDWRRGFKFSTYATWWIRQAITRGIADRGKTIRLPVHVGERVRKLKATAWRINQTEGVEPSHERLAKELDMPPQEIKRLFDLDERQPVSIHTPIGEDNELLDLISQTGAEAPMHEVEDEIVRQEIGQTMDALLTDQEREVLRLRYGLANGQPLSLREAGKLMNLSAERVRQIEREAFGKLRDSEVISAAAGY
jgi:RNA polymerase sigma factor (sigma-70 family)